MHAFYERVRARRGNDIAAVAVAGKLAALAWHLLSKGEDYAWTRPALLARKMRALELCAGLPARRGRKGASYDYNLPERRAKECEHAEQAENAYWRLTQGWRRRGPGGAGAAIEERQ